MLTDAGRKLRNLYLSEESAGRLRRFVDGAGNSFTGMPLFGGDGGQLACAKKMARDGLATLKYGKSNRHCCFNLTDAGRNA